MSGFMEGYGVKDERRGRIVKRTILLVLTVAIVGTAGYFYFRTWSQERTVSAFLDKLESKDFAGAYAMWCGANPSCKKYYPLERFQEDWAAANSGAAKIDNVETCGDGVLFNIRYPGVEPVDVMVQKADNTMGFAPWPQCPGKRLTFRPLMEKLFGPSNPQPVSPTSPKG